MVIGPIEVSWLQCAYVNDQPPSPIFFPSKGYANLRLSLSRKINVVNLLTRIEKICANSNVHLSPT